jgi:hypothetical protein
LSERIGALEIEDWALIGVYLTANSSRIESHIEHSVDVSQMITAARQLGQQGKKVLLMGGFNSDPLRGNQHDRILTEALDHDEYFFIDKDLIFSRKSTYSGPTGCSNIDHFVSNADVFNLVSSVRLDENDATNFSDHRAVLAEMELTSAILPAKVNKPRRIDWRNQVLVCTYQSELDASIRALGLVQQLERAKQAKDRYETQLSIDDVFKGLCSLMIKIANETQDTLRPPLTNQDANANRRRRSP